MTTLDSLKATPAYKLDSEYKNETYYSGVPDSKICLIDPSLGLPLGDFKATDKRVLLNLEPNQKLPIFRNEAKVRVNILNDSGNYSKKINYKDLFEYQLSTSYYIDSKYLLKKTNYPSRIIRIGQGVIFNETDEILVMITKSVKDESFILYIATEVFNKPIYKSLLSKLKTYLIKPFEEEDLTIVRMNIQKLTNLFYPKYEDEITEGEIPEIIKI